MVKGKRKGKIVVLHLAGRYPFAGVIWQLLHHLIGFRQLGLDVYYVEEQPYVYDPTLNSNTGDTSRNLKVLGDVLDRYGFGDRWSFFDTTRDEYVGMSRERCMELFRDSDQLREHRERARLKFLFLRHGWTPQDFQHELERRIGFRLDPAVPEHPPADVYRDHIGIHPQKQPGYCYVGATVLRGRITPEQMHAAADLSDRFASGELRTTNMQNLLIVNVPRLQADELAKELGEIGLPVSGSPFWRGAVACSGTEFCKLAITETKSFSRWLVEELEERLPGFDQHLKLHVTGCPNSCGQHWIADIGIEGKKIKVNGQMVDAYYFCLGGALGLSQSIARPVGYRCPATEVPEAIERLLRRYLADGMPGENLRRFFARHTDTDLRGFLAGEFVEAVARDLPEGRVPSSVEG